jgi:hypothetical protein
MCLSFDARDLPTDPPPTRTTPHPANALTSTALDATDVAQPREPVVQRDRTGATVV